MLAALSQVFARHEAVVTFNGKSFDVPLLLTRYTANRQRPSVPTEIHLDLPYPSRRFWREQLESCTLGTLERAVLGHSRRYDVPSWMIPDLYFSYLRGEDPREMVAVFEHNLHDLLSLVALTCRLGRLLDGLVVSVEADSGLSVFELFAAARIYEDLGLLEEAYARYEQALVVGATSRCAPGFPARRRSASRAGRHERAVQLWKRLAALGLTASRSWSWPSTSSTASATTTPPSTSSRRRWPSRSCGCCDASPVPQPSGRPGAPAGLASSRSASALPAEPIPRPGPQTASLYFSRPATCP